MNYFAYGSNMLLVRIRERVPSARRLAVATLSGYALRFHQHGRDGSGKCNAQETSDPADRVHGVVYTMDSQDRERLDEAESLGKGYDEKTVTLGVGERTLSAFLYVARPGSIDDTLRPFQWYRDLVLAGARENALPEEYVTLITAVTSIPDPDEQRARTHRALLRPSGT